MTKTELIKEIKEKINRTIESNNEPLEKLFGEKQFKRMHSCTIIAKQTIFDNFETLITIKDNVKEASNEELTNVISQASFQLLQSILQSAEIIDTQENYDTFYKDMTKESINILDKDPTIAKMFKHMFELKEGLKTNGIIS